MPAVNAIYHGGRKPKQRAVIWPETIENGQVMAQLIDQGPPWNEVNWFSLKSFTRMNGVPFVEEGNQEKERQ